MMVCCNDGLITYLAQVHQYDPISHMIELHYPLPQQTNNHQVSIHLCDLIASGLLVG